jgi:transposase-like protein
MGEACGHFPREDAAIKLIWLTLRELTKNWQMPARAWHASKALFGPFFGDRCESAR